MSVFNRSILEFILAALLSGAPGVNSAVLERQPNATLRLPPGAPTFGYFTEPAFGALTFNNPVAIAVAPGETNRLFVVEQAGRISVITNLAAPTRTVFLDISTRLSSGGEKGLLGLAFHPDWKASRFFYVFYTLNTNTAAGTGLHDRLSRFQISPDNPHRALPDSEQPLITQFDEAQNHNGGDLHFGPDGFLYVSLGDEGQSNDSLQNSQRINKDFFAGILRLDVDSRPGNPAPNPHPANTDENNQIHYVVPADNPFVGATSFNGVAVDPASVRTEFWAVGLRNPWRFSYDPGDDRWYCGDVGQGKVEEVDILVKGGNYGWNYREGNIAGPRTPPGGLNFIEPIATYTHGTATNQGLSITGGLVYRGTRLPELVGAYVFADYASGNLWALRYNGTSPVPLAWLASNTGISAFGADPRNGDLLFCDLNADTIKRLNFGSVPGDPVPATLADTGAFTDLTTLKSAPGVVPYDINAPFWSDGARKRRWFSVPDVTQTIAFAPEANWSFPTGTVWIKHFDLELTNGAPASARRVETRFLVRTTNGVYGVSYRWDDSQTNAQLVDPAGRDESFQIHDGATVRTQTWHYPSRAECLVCHTPAGGWALGFNTGQLNCDFTYAGGTENQLRAFSDAGYFTSPAPSPHLLRAYVAATNTEASLEARVRSYLAANCAQCHQPGATAPGFFDARFATPLANAGLIEGVLNDPDEPVDRVIKPGSLNLSELYQRVANFGARHMPPLATSELNTAALDLLAAWITNDLPAWQSFADWQTARFGSTTAPEAAADADPDRDGAPNRLEYLTGTNSKQPGDAWGITTLQLADGGVEIVFPQVVNRGFEVQFTTDLSDPASWQPLAVPGNEPFAAAAPQVRRVRDLPAAATRYYRVRVIEF